MDVICSHGLLEHFKEDEDIKSSIVEALRVADTYVCVVPLENAKNSGYRRVLGLSPLTAINATGNFGDEVYRPGSEWEGIINEALTEVPNGRLESKYGYWVPKFGSTFTHPQSREEAAELYENGDTIYGVYVVTKAQTPE